MSAINHVDPPDLSLPKQPWKKGGGWSRSRSRRCCRGIRWDSPILGDLSNKYGDIIGVIIGVIGNVPCITKKIFKKYVENGFSPETHWTIRHETGLNPLAKHHVFYETERNGNFGSCALFSDTPWIGKLGMSPELWGYLIQEWENWPIENWEIRLRMEMFIKGNGDLTKKFWTIKSTDIDWGLTGQRTFRKSGKAANNMMRTARLAWPVGCVAKRSSGEAGRLQDRNIME